MQFIHIQMKHIKLTLWSFCVQLRSGQKPASEGALKQIEELLFMKAELQSKLQQACHNVFFNKYEIASFTKCLTCKFGH